MKRPQWITIAVAVFLVTVIYVFGRTVPSTPLTPKADDHAGHDHEKDPHTISTDTLLALAKRQLRPEQALRVSMLENSITRGDVKEQQLHVYHRLSRFWADSVGMFIPYAWYTAEAARLENSEKSLTFAAHLLLNNLISEQNNVIREWEALQAKDLFERSLKINPANDSSKVGLGSCYLFANISDNPMEGISHIREVAARDSNNVFAQLMLARGAVISQQFDRAIERLEKVNRLQPDNLEAIFTLAEVYERQNDKANAVAWYSKSLPLIRNAAMKAEVEKRIDMLK